MAKVIEQSGLSNNLKKCPFKFYDVTTIEDLPNEEWMPIPIFYGCLMASNMGRIKGLPYCYIDEDNNEISIPETIIQQQHNRDGYLYIKTDHKRHYSAHRLIASAFLKTFDEKPVVNHINGIRDANYISNLEMVTYQQNSFHGIHRSKNNSVGVSVMEILKNRKLSKIERGQLIFKVQKTLHPFMLIYATLAIIYTHSEITGMTVEGFFMGSLFLVCTINMRVFEGDPDAETPDKIQPVFIILAVIAFSFFIVSIIAYFISILTTQ